MTPRSDEDEVMPRTEARRPSLDELLSVFAAEQARVESQAHAPVPTLLPEPEPASNVLDVADTPAAPDVPAFEDAPDAAEVAPQPDGRRFGKRTWTIVSWAGVLVAALAFLVLGGLILVPRAMGWQGMVVLSGSMEPALKTGGLAFVQPLSREQVDSLQAGDIITFRSSKIAGLISHRIVQVNPGDGGPSFVTKGDANPQPDDGQVAAASVVGKVRFTVPYLGRLVERLHNRSTYLLFLGIPAGLLIAGELWNIASELQRARREKTEHGDIEGAVL